MIQLWLYGVVEFLGLVGTMLSEGRTLINFAGSRCQDDLYPFFIQPAKAVSCTYLRKVMVMPDFTHKIPAEKVSLLYVTEKNLSNNVGLKHNLWYQQ